MVAYTKPQQRKNEGMIKYILNRVQEFKHLGSTVQSDGALDKEVSKRIQAGWNAWRKMTGVLCD